MSMSGKLKKIEKFLDTLGRDYPTETQACMNFMRKAEGGPALDMKTRELINIGISISAQCEWCIAFHAKAALEAGATEDEIMKCRLHGSADARRPGADVHDAAGRLAGGVRQRRGLRPAADEPACAPRGFRHWPERRPGCTMGALSEQGLARRSPC